MKNYCRDYNGPKHTVGRLPHGTASYSNFPLEWAAKTSEVLMVTDDRSLVKQKMAIAGVLSHHRSFIPSPIGP
jgi:hypothetical protein